MTPMNSVLPAIVAESCRTLQSLLGQQEIFDQIAAAMVTTLRSGGKILTCGNGGSAADALHMAEELVGRFKQNRRSLPAISLNADPTLLTCIGNDFGFDFIFSRQVEGLGVPGDLIVCYSTSGNSRNILLALEAAKKQGVRSVALLGKDGGKAKGQANFEIIVANHDSGRVQEAHTLLMHALLEVVEREFTA